MIKHLVWALTVALITCVFISIVEAQSPPQDCDGIGHDGLLPGKFCFEEQIYIYDYTHDYQIHMYALKDMYYRYRGHFVFSEQLYNFWANSGHHRHEHTDYIRFVDGKYAGYIQEQEECIYQNIFNKVSDFTNRNRNKRWFVEDALQHKWSIYDVTIDEGGAYVFDMMAKNENASTNKRQSIYERCMSTFGDPYIAQAISDHDAMKRTDFSHDYCSTTAMDVFLKALSYTVMPLAIHRTGFRIMLGWSF